ncbi:DUF6894 family protein [Methylobacterium sp. J-068]|uniref:DUF6894 family protein n=1 Tax=Methylobacterium sp. J-068 TaxID=2836649 RepID=UPI001FB9E2FF|nr:hypothetical protein [Methylobacterium sp. J-068]MCJ2033744.1 hypothetical protein [Methylobacterium sp. J-068]
MLDRFFFDLTNGAETLRDEIGAEATDIDEARREAQVVLGEIGRTGELDDSSGRWTLLIRNRDGVVLERVEIDALNS